METTSQRAYLADLWLSLWCSGATFCNLLSSSLSLASLNSTKTRRVHTFKLQMKLPLLIRFIVLQTLLYASSDTQLSRGKNWDQARERLERQQKGQSSSWSNRLSNSESLILNWWWLILRCPLILSFRPSLILLIQTSRVSKIQFLHRLRWNRCLPRSKVTR